MHIKERITITLIQMHQALREAVAPLVNTRMAVKCTGEHIPAGELAYEWCTPRVIL